MRHHLDRRLGERAAEFSVSSAGTWGCAGSSAEDFALAALRQRGIDARDFVARELSVNMLREADLILTATTEHRGYVVGMEPAAVRRTFTLREFARLQPLVSPTELDSLSLPQQARLQVEKAGLARGMGDRPMAGENDIEDPLGAPAAFYQARAADIELASHRAVDLLLGQLH